MEQRFRPLPRQHRRPTHRRYAGLGIVWCLLAANFTGFAAKFSVTIDRESVVIGENLTLTLTFDGVSPGRVPQLPNMPGLQVAGGYSSGSNMSLGPDGKMHTVQTFSVPLMANQVGEFTIPAFQIEFEGQRLSSQPLKVKVLREDPSAPPATLGNRSAFLWLALPRNEFYVGEPIAAELRFYRHESVQRIGDFQLPSLQADGLNAGPWVQGQAFRRVVGGRGYIVVPLFCIVTPVKTGPLTLGQLKGAVVLNPPDVFESLWGRGGRSERVELAFAGLPIQALPLPVENVPTDFNGAIGTFTLALTAGPTNVAVGDPITIRVSISGRGAFDTVKLPEQKSWAHFKTYQANANLQTSDSLGLHGTKTFEQIVSPETAELKELPPFSFSFFDPDAKQYRTLTQPPVKLVVNPAAAVTTPLLALPTRAGEPAPPPARDIVHIKTRPGQLAQIGPPLIQRPWFLAVQGVPVLVWLAAIGWRKRTDALANNPRLRRQRVVAQLLRDGLMELRSHATAKNSDAFFATLVRLLQEQLGERLDCPASAITEAVVDEKLRPRAVAEATLNELHELFQACNLARYAPVQSSHELAALVPRFEAVVQELQNLKT